MIRLLVVDDSAVMRRLIGAAFEAEADVDVGFARSGEEALALLEAFRPDVVTLDVIMPGMDGLTCLAGIMRLRPCPVLVVSGVAGQGAQDAARAMDLGAFDLVAKPRGMDGSNGSSFAQDLRRKVRAAAAASLPQSGRAGGAAMRAPVPPPAAADPFFPVVLVGASTGGPAALAGMLSALPADFPGAMVICQHLGAQFTGRLAARLDTLCALPVTELGTEAPLRRGHVHLGRGDADLVVARAGAGPGLVVRSVAADPDRLWHPSTERLVESALGAVDPRRLVGVLLTGMGDDGAAAMTDLRRRGGRTLAEAEATAAVWGMPRALIQRGGADRVVPLPDMAGSLMGMLRGRRAG